MHSKKFFDIDTIENPYMNLDNSQEYIENLKRAILQSLLDNQLLTKQQYDSCTDRLNKHRE